MHPFRPSHRFDSYASKLAPGRSQEDVDLDLNMYCNCDLERTWKNIERRQKTHCCKKQMKKWHYDLKRPFTNGCFNSKIPKLYMGNGCCTKHPFKNSCLKFQEEKKKRKHFWRPHPAKDKSLAAQSRFGSWLHAVVTDPICQNVSNVDSNPLGHSNWLFKFVEIPYDIWDMIRLCIVLSKVLCNGTSPSYGTWYFVFNAFKSTFLYHAFNPTIH